MFNLNLTSSYGDETRPDTQPFRLCDYFIHFAPWTQGMYKLQQLHSKKENGHEETNRLPSCSFPSRPAHHQVKYLQRSRKFTHTLQRVQRVNAYDVRVYSYSRPTALQTGMIKDARKLYNDVLPGKLDFLCGGDKTKR